MAVSYGRYALIVAVAAGALAAVGHARYLKGLRETEPVVVMARQVEPYSILTESDLRVEHKPKGSAGPGALHDPAQAAGMYVKGAMFPGDILRETHLAEVQGGHLATRLAAEGSPSARAMAITVEADTGVAHTLRPGDRVDILASVSMDAETYSKIIAQNILVLHTTADGSDLDSGAGATVVLQVDPHLAEEIAFAQGNGHIWLLAAPQGAERHQTTGMDMTRFRQKYKQSAVGGGN